MALAQERNPVALPRTTPPRCGEEHPGPSEKSAEGSMFGGLCELHVLGPARVRCCISYARLRQDAARVAGMTKDGKCSVGAPTAILISSRTSEATSAARRSGIQHEERAEHTEYGAFGAPLAGSRIFLAAEPRLVVRDDGGNSVALLAHHDGRGGAVLCGYTRRARRFGGPGTAKSRPGPVASAGRRGNSRCRLLQACWFPPWCPRS